MEKKEKGKDLYKGYRMNGEEGEPEKGEKRVKGEREKGRKGEN